MVIRHILRRERLPYVLRFLTHQGVRLNVKVEATTLGFLTAIITLSIIVLLVLLINRIATAALMSTGMSREMARFQSRSALSTVGFTTAESESVVNHPVRRRIIAILMIVGNAGFVGLIATVLGTFTGEAEGLAVWK